ncbi:hypothetical protein NH340_JMT00874 [Sarcoptes scabiei]|nr:hypothetical protein NH340_JMT00874 [Sarcoptes scabiei]
MDLMDEKIQSLLNGEIKDDEEKEFLHIDYSLQQQNFELTSRGIDPKVSSEFRPKVGLNITLVVTAVIFDDSLDVLMMQEAKTSCAKSWYLPAARVEPLERLDEAVKRGVLLETGLVIEPTTILKVESSHGNWFRFVYTGDVISGTLKTISRADQESLQACYMRDVTKINLRSKDCLKLIELGREYYRAKHLWHPKQSILIRSVPNLMLRLFIVVRDSQR